MMLQAFLKERRSWILFFLSLQLHSICCLFGYDHSHRFSFLYCDIVYISHDCLSLFSIPKRNGLL